MAATTERRNRLTVLFAMVAMVIVLLSPAHLPATSVFAELSLYDMQVAANLSVGAHANHHGVSHDHVHDLLNSGHMTLDASSTPRSAWRQFAAQGLPLTLDLAPDQPPRS